MYNKGKRYRNTSHLPKNINNVPINRLKYLTEKSCIILSFSRSAYNYIEIIIIKAHILFGKRKPEIYMNPIKNAYGIGLHSNCNICEFWLSNCIEGNKEIIQKLSNILYYNNNPIVLYFSPYLQKMIFFSEISDKDTVNETIIKKILPVNNNLYISARVDVNENRNYVINIFKKITKFSWFNMLINKFSFARCSIFMNFVNEYDIFEITKIFPEEIYENIFHNCKVIRNKNYILFPNNNMNNPINKYAQNEQKEKLLKDINYMRNKEDIIELSEDEN